MAIAILGPEFAGKLQPKGATSFSTVSNKTKHQGGRRQNSKQRRRPGIKRKWKSRPTALRFRYPIQSRVMILKESIDPSRILNGNNEPVDESNKFSGKGKWERGMAKWPNSNAQQEAPNRWIATSDETVNGFDSMISRGNTIDVLDGANLRKLRDGV